MQHAIRFETYALPQPPDPARMDVTCFVGYAAQRTGAAVPEALAADLAQAFGQKPEAFSLPGGLYNRPVPATSVGEFEGLFDDKRLEQRASIDGGPMAETLPGSGVADTLHIVIDGIIHAVPLSPLPASPQEAVQRIEAAGLGLEVSLQDHPGGRFLRLALPLTHGAGTLAVLPNPTLGFPQTRRVGARAIPSPLGMAVRQFFAMGGAKAIIVSMGATPVYDANRADRLAALRALFLPGTADNTIGAVSYALSGPALSPVSEPGKRHGVTQLYGLTDATFLCLPDLPELCAPPPAFPAVRPAPEEPIEVFADCLPPESLANDAAQSLYPAPELDQAGHILWQAAVRRVAGVRSDARSARVADDKPGLLASYARDTIFLAALPRAERSLPAIEPPRSAFLQLAEGWVRSNASALAPQGLMAPDAVLAGHLARRALTGGTFLSAAALPLAPLRDIERRAGHTEAPTCRLVADLHGISLTGDLTTSDDPDWADGPVSRIMAMLLRQSRQFGQEIAFEPNAPSLWARTRAVLAGLLTAMWRAGALAGATPHDAFEVRCDRSTMSQQDIDTGVLIAEVTFSPTVPVQRITVRLPLTEAPAARIQSPGGPA